MIREVLSIVEAEYSHQEYSQIFHLYCFGVRFASHLAQTVPHVKYEATFWLFLACLGFAQHSKMNQKLLELQVVYLSYLLTFWKSFLEQDLMNLFKLSRKFIDQVLVRHL